MRASACPARCEAVHLVCRLLVEPGRSVLRRPLSRGRTAAGAGPAHIAAFERVQKLQLLTMNQLQWARLTKPATEKEAGIEEVAGLERSSVRRCGPRGTLCLKGMLLAFHVFASRPFHVVRRRAGLVCLPQPTSLTFHRLNALQPFCGQNLSSGMSGWSQKTAHVMHMCVELEPFRKISIELQNCKQKASIGRTPLNPTVQPR